MIKHQLLPDNVVQQVPGVVLGLYILELGQNVESEAVRLSSLFVAAI